MPVQCSSLRSGRTLYSSHGSWEIARNGFGVFISSAYNYPNPRLMCRTELTALYCIERAHLTLDTQKVKGGILTAKLRIYVVELVAWPTYLYITKGAHGDIVDTGIWGSQNGYADIGGQILFTDLVLNAWNEIPLNATGISWINSSSSEKKQYEGFDDGGTTCAEIHIPWKWCMFFTPVDSHTIKSVRLYAAKKGTGCGIVTVNVKAADANHLPTGAALASGEFNSATLGAAYDWITVDLGDGAELSADTEYCFELIPASGNDTNKAQVRVDTSGAYTRGQLAFWDGVTWTAYPAYDIYFLEYSDEDVGGTRLCLRTAFDLNNTPPTIGQTTKAVFRAYDPVLEVTLVPPIISKAYALARKEL